jgi:hypothetical protein
VRRFNGPNLIFIAYNCSIPNCLAAEARNMTMSNAENIATTENRFYSRPPRIERIASNLLRSISRSNEAYEMQNQERSCQPLQPPRHPIAAPFLNYHPPTISSVTTSRHDEKN